MTVKPETMNRTGRRTAEHKARKLLTRRKEPSTGDRHGCQGHRIHRRCHHKRQRVPSELLNIPSIDSCEGGLRSNSGKPKRH